METGTEFILNPFENQDVWRVHEFEGSARALLYGINRVAGLNVSGIERGVDHKCNSEQSQSRICG